MNKLTLPEDNKSQKSIEALLKSSIESLVKRGRPRNIFDNSMKTEEDAKTRKTRRATLQNLVSREFRKSDVIPPSIDMRQLEGNLFLKKPQKIDCDEVLGLQGNKEKFLKRLRSGGNRLKAYTKQFFCKADVLLKVLIEVIIEFLTELRKLYQEFDNYEKVVAKWRKIIRSRPFLDDSEMNLNTPRKAGGGVGGVEELPVAVEEPGKREFEEEVFLRRKIVLQFEEDEGGDRGCRKHSFELDQPDNRSFSNKNEVIGEEAELGQIPKEQKTGESGGKGEVQEQDEEVIEENYEVLSERLGESRRFHQERILNEEVSQFKFIPVINEEIDEHSNEESDNEEEKEEKGEKIEKEGFGEIGRKSPKIDLGAKKEAENAQKGQKEDQENKEETVKVTVPTLLYKGLFKFRAAASTRNNSTISSVNTFKRQMTGVSSNSSLNQGALQFSGLWSSPSEDHKDTLLSGQFRAEKMEVIKSKAEIVSEEEPEEYNRFSVGQTKHHNKGSQNEAKMNDLSQSQKFLSKHSLTAIEPSHMHGRISTGAENKTKNEPGGADFDKDQDRRPTPSFQKEPLKRLEANPEPAAGPDKHLQELEMSKEKFYQYFERGIINNKKILSKIRKWENQLTKCLAEILRENKAPVDKTKKEVRAEKKKLKKEAKEAKKKQKMDQKQKRATIQGSSKRGDRHKDDTSNQRPEPPQTAERDGILQKVYNVFKKFSTEFSNHMRAIEDAGSLKRCSLFENNDPKLSLFILEHIIATRMRKFRESLDQQAIHNLLSVVLEVHAVLNDHHHYLKTKMIRVDKIGKKKFGGEVWSSEPLTQPFFSREFKTVQFFEIIQPDYKKYIRGKLNIKNNIQMRNTDLIDFFQFYLIPFNLESEFLYGFLKCNFVQGAEDMINTNCILCLDVSADRFPPIWATFRDFSPSANLVKFWKIFDFCSFF